MRNLKKNANGFTLVELIVVMAIIGVLAAVLVPSMLGFMRDSRISQANQNAHTVYTAATTCLTKFTTANGTALTKTGKTFVAPAALTGTTGQTSVIAWAAGKTTDIVPYLGGDKFKGTWGFKTTSSGDAVAVAAYSMDKTIVAADVKVYTDVEQDTAYKAGNLVGFSE